MPHQLRTELPPITLKRSDSARLGRLAEAAAKGYPVTAEFLARELDRATVVADDIPLSGIVCMESEVVFRDDASGRDKRVKLVYPDAADVEAGRISVLTPIGAALIGLSAGQAITFETPTGAQRSLTIIAVGAAG
jgi:regulator of nucleoside diphosphate kinase